MQVFGGTAEQLKCFNINIAPPENVWVQVDKANDIWFKQVLRAERVASVAKRHLACDASG